MSSSATAAYLLFSAPPPDRADPVGDAFRLHRTRLLRRLRSKGAGADAEDLVQDIFLRRPAGTVRSSTQVGSKVGSSTVQVGSKTTTRMARCARAPGSRAACPAGRAVVGQPSTRRATRRPRSAPTAAPSSARPGTRRSTSCAPWCTRWPATPTSPPAAARGHGPRRRARSGRGNGRRRRPVARTAAAALGAPSPQARPSGRLVAQRPASASPRRGRSTRGGGCAGAARRLLVEEQARVDRRQPGREPLLHRRGRGARRARGCGVGAELRLRRGGLWREEREGRGRGKRREGRGRGRGTEGREGTEGMRTSCRGRSSYAHGASCRREIWGAFHRRALLVRRHQARTVGPIRAAGRHAPSRGPRIRRPSSRARAATPPWRRQISTRPRHRKPAENPG